MLGFLAKIMAILAGGFVSRANGGGYRMNRWLTRVLGILPFIAACYPFAGAWALLAGVGVIGMITGRGQYFLSRLLEGQGKGEQIDPFVRLFFGRDWRCEYPDDFTDFNLYEREYYYTQVKPKLYWRNLFGLFTLGSIVALPSFILAVVFGQWEAAILFAFVGITEALAYAIVAPHTTDTAPAEWLRGISRTLVAMLALTLFDLKVVTLFGVSLWEIAGFMTIFLALISVCIYLTLSWTIWKATDNFGKTLRDKFITEALLMVVTLIFGFGAWLGAGTWLWQLAYVCRVATLVMTPYVLFAFYQACLDVIKTKKAENAGDNH